jgi:autotransporter-associated beta strand protein
LNLGLGNVLTTGVASFNGNLNITSGTVSPTLPETLISYPSYTGTFAHAYNVPSGDLLSYTPTALLLISSGPFNLTYLNAGGIWDSAISSSFNGPSGATTFHTGDTVTFDDSYPTGPYTVTISGVVSPGGTIFNSSTGYTVTGFNGSSGIAGSGSLTFLGSGTTIISSSNTYTGGTFVNNGKLILASATAFPAGTNLSIGSTAAVVLANHSSGSASVISVNSLTLTGQLDLTNNGMVLHNGTLGTVFNQVNQGFNGGTWNGSGIASSAAAGNTTHLTALGVIINDTTANSSANASGMALYASLGSTPTVDGDILVKYTYYGDANLSGAVDGSDYSLIDNGYLNHLTGWYNGDFNYDGVVDGSDYTLIDNAFNSQAAAISSEIAAPTAQLAGQLAGSGATSAVPEPASLGVIALGAAGVLGRRRRISTLLAGAK